MSIFRPIFLIGSVNRLIFEIIIRQKSTYTKYIESFQYRILNYFEKSLNDRKHYQKYEICTQVKENIYQNIILKQKLEIVYQQFCHLESSNNHKQQKQLAEIIDSQCLSIINSLNQNEIFILLNKFLKLFPIGLTSTHFYTKSIMILFELVECELLNNNEIVQLIFFISLQKENGAKFIQYIKPFLPNMNDLPLFEKCIVAQSFYKSSQAIPLEHLKIFETAIEEHSEQLLNDPLLLVSLCKIIRISKPTNALTLQNLSEIIVKLKRPLSFPTTIHILSLYADALLFHPKATHHLFKDAIKMIEKDSIKLNLRLKDIGRYLWAVTYLNLPLTLDEKQILQMYFQIRLKEFKLKKNLGIFVTSTLCMHLLQCYNKKIIESCFEEHIFESVFYENYHWKIRSRLQLLINLINIEMKITIPHRLKKQINISYTSSEKLNIIAEVGSLLASKGILKNPIVECPIKALQIPGLTFKKNNIFHIDVLDNFTCLKNTNIPHGYMKLKLRLLSQLNYHQILIDKEVFENDDLIKIRLAIEQKILNSLSMLS